MLVGPLVGPFVGCPLLFTVVFCFMSFKVILSISKVNKSFLSQFTFNLLVFWSFGLLVFWSYDHNNRTRLVSSQLLSTIYGPNSHQCVPLFVNPPLIFSDMETADGILKGLTGLGLMLISLFGKGQLVLETYFIPVS